MSARSSVPRLLEPGNPVTARVRTAGILIPFIILFAVLALTSSSFATKPNLLNILDQQSAILIIAAAGTLVLVAGGIDLSVGLDLLAGRRHLGAFRARDEPRPRHALGIGAGLLIGLANGLITTVLRINALIATLAMSFIVSGLRERSSRRAICSCSSTSPASASSRAPSFSRSRRRSGS